MRNCQKVPAWTTPCHMKCSGAHGGRHWSMKGYIELPSLYRASTSVETVGTEMNLDEPQHT